jgi:hypothetical protein
VSWLDIATAADSERGRHAIWREELRRRAEDQSLTDAEHDTLRRGIRDHARGVAVFEAMARMIDRVRADSYILGRLRDIDEAERRTAGATADTIENDE